MLELGAGDAEPVVRQRIGLKAGSMDGLLQEILRSPDGLMGAGKLLREVVGGRA
jgi:hypothetical protein